MSQHMILFIASLAIAISSNLSADENNEDANKLPVELLTVEGVKAYANANNIMTVDHLMDELPNVLLSNYVLMEDSRSRQKPSTVDKPRIVMFLPDGSFFLGVATNEKSVGYNDAEMLESRNDGTWKLGALRLEARSAFHGRIHEGGRQLSEKRGCTGCHGSNSRPIWGRYPQWPGAFANGAGHDLTSKQAKALNNALASGNKNQNVRLQKLIWKKRANWHIGENFDLPNRNRGLLNEAMNDVVGTQHFDNLYRRIKKSEISDLLMLTMLFESSEFDSVNGVHEIRTKLTEFVNEKWKGAGHDYPNATTPDKVLVLLGLDPYDDLFIPNGLHELSKPESKEFQFQFNWNFIAIYSGDLLRFYFLDELLKEHPEVQIGKALVDTDYEYSQQYESLFEYHRTNVRFMHELSLEEKIAYLTSKSAPTVGLRIERLLTPKLLQKITPALIVFGEQQLKEHQAD